MPLDTDLAPPVVLTFAASDPTGGAGIQADLLTLASLGCHPLSVVTALTVQDTAGVEAVLAIDAGWVADQARALLEDIPVAAFKFGMLGSVETIAAIAEIVNDYPDIPLVFDPVLASGRGDQLADEAMIEAMVGLLLPRTTVLTPNSLEARRLAQDDENDADAPDLSECARRLVGAGAEYVLITGTHEQSPQVVNTLYGSGAGCGPTSGNGCRAAIMVPAVPWRRPLPPTWPADSISSPRCADAQDYTWRALAAGFRAGMGQIIPDRFFWARDEETDDDD